MMLAISALKGFAIEASDGRIGSVSDVLFDDRSWKIRWLVVDTGGWLTGRLILVHPSAIGQPDYRRETLPVRLTKHQIEESPSILLDKPVSQQMETDLYGYYGWDPLWGGGNYFGAYPYESEVLESARDARHGDPHLRSVTEVTGYHIQASDGSIGHIETILVDDATWGVRYLVIDTKNWWFGQHVLMSPYAVRSVSWSQRDVTLRVTREQVKGSPAWDPADIIDRSYQERLHGYYDWPGYGW